MLRRLVFLVLVAIWPLSICRGDAPVPPLDYKHELEYSELLNNEHADRQKLHRETFDYESSLLGRYLDPHTAFGYQSLPHGKGSAFAKKPHSRDPEGASKNYRPNCTPNSLLDITSLRAFAYPFPLNGLSFTIGAQLPDGTAILFGLEAKGSGDPQGGGNGTVAGLVMKTDGTPLTFNGAQVTGTAPFSFPNLTNFNLDTPTNHITTCTLIPTQTIGTLTSNQETTADPISTASGAYVVPPTMDLFLGGPLSLFVRRSFSSVTIQNTGLGILGYGWATNFDPYITSDSKYLAVILDDGRVTFQINGSNFQPAFPGRLPYQLVRGATGGFRFLDPGQNLIYNFTPNGSLTKIEDRNGNALTVTQGNKGPMQVTDGLGRTLTFTYPAAYVGKITDQSGRSVSYTQVSANLTRFTDANGNTTTYAYNPYTAITKITRPRGNVPYTQNYDALFRVGDQTDSMGNKTTMSYVSGGTPGLTKVTDPLGRITAFAYPNLVDLSSVTDAAGQSSSVAYDSVHRPIAFTDRLGNKTTLTYDAASGNPASVTDAQGNTTSYTYQSKVQGDFTFYNLTKIAYADGTSESFAYDASGNVLKATDRAGKTTTYTYNSRGQVLTATNAAGGVTAYTYNPDATLATRNLPSGDVTTYTYDNIKRVAKIQYADNTSVSFTRDALDRILSVTDERGKVTKLAYDSNNNFQSVTDALNQTSKLTYDTDDLPSTSADPLGNSTQVQYDPLGSAIAITNAAGEMATFTYDNLERVKSLADSSGKGPSFTYDAEGRPATITDALGNTASIVVNKNGLPTQLTSPLAENTTISYDALNRVTVVSDALNRQTTYGYENRGLPAAINAPGGLTASFAWGDLPFLNSVTDPNGSAWSIARDNLGRVTSATDPLGQARSYKYDARSRISSMTTPLDSAQLTYDQAGNLTRAQFSDNTVVSFTYDDDNRLTGGTGFALGYDAAGRLTSSNGLNIARDAVGRISSIIYAPGKTVTYSYDGRGLLSSIKDWTGGSITFTFNDARQLVNAARSNGVVTQYTYDKDQRLASITDAKGGNTLASIALLRDAIGRLTSSNRNVPQEASLPATTTSLAYNAAHQILSAKYDVRGRLLGDDSGAAYQWSASSWLVSYKRPDGSASLTYDGLGQRISRTVGGNIVNYVLNYATVLPGVATLRSGGSDVRYYVYTPEGSLLFSIAAATGAHRFYSFDDTGSTTFLTDDSGAITDSYGISAYGETVTAGPNNSTDNPFTWQGQFGVMQEPASGLYYARFRYYDSATARFLSRDPLFSLLPREINPYQYAAGNPVANGDPLGLKSVAKDSYGDDHKYQPFDITDLAQDCLPYQAFARGPHIVFPGYLFSGTKYGLGLTEWGDSRPEGDSEYSHGYRPRRCFKTYEEITR